MTRASRARPRWPAHLRLRAGACEIHRHEPFACLGNARRSWPALFLLGERDDGRRCQHRRGPARWGYRHGASRYGLGVPDRRAFMRERMRRRSLERTIDRMRAWLWRSLPCRACERDRIVRRRRALRLSMRRTVHPRIRPLHVHAHELQRLARNMRRARQRLWNALELRHLRDQLNVPRRRVLLHTGCERTQRHRVDSALPWHLQRRRRRRDELHGFERSQHGGW